MIGPATRTAWLLGSPLGHTLSPAMHNAAYRDLGLDLVYLAARVEPAGLGRALEGLAALGAVGCNLTLPLKEAALPHLRHLEEPARSLGAVNTVRFGPSGPVGLNTDAEGWLRSWDEEVGEPLEGRSALILGAGGAARAVFWALASRGVGEIRVLARGVERARRLVGDLARPDLRASVGPAPLCPGMVVIQATPAGMEPDPSGTAFPWPDEVPPGVVACDLVYRPRQTRFLREATERGARTLGGLGMLVHQAAAAVEAWTGRRPEARVLRDAALAALEVPRPGGRALS